jgi:transposase-like protein
MKRDGRSLEHNTLAEMRRMAVQRVVEEGAKPSAIAAQYGFCRTYLYRWVEKFRKEG